MHLDGKGCGHGMAVLPGGGGGGQIWGMEKEVTEAQ